MVVGNVNKIMSRICTKFNLFESKTNNSSLYQYDSSLEINSLEKKSGEVLKEVERFSRKWGIELDPEFEIDEINLISKALGYYNTDFIKNRIDKIIKKDLGAVRGRWIDTKTKKWMYLNPKIYKLKKRWKNDDVNLPYGLFTIVHEIAHCVDYIERISFSKEWQSISGWKKCDRDEKLPEGYDRYIEKRPGRAIPGQKKSNWIFKHGSDFCRKYSSKNPREDFADSLSFVILGLPEKLKGDGGKKKLEIIKKLLKKVD